MKSAYPTRKSFIQSLGAECRNWTWSWSFVNHAKRQVIFGAWDVNFENGQTLILSEQWARRDGRRNPGYTESLEHLQLVLAENYELYTFKLIYSAERAGSDGHGPSTIKDFERVLHRKWLLQRQGDWFACDTPQQPPA